MWSIAMTYLHQSCSLLCIYGLRTHNRRMNKLVGFYDRCLIGDMDKENDLIDFLGYFAAFPVSQSSLIRTKSMGKKLQGEYIPENTSVAMHIFYRYTCYMFGR